MKIAILGGGITGLSAAYDLSQKGHEVVLYEKENYWGGMASGVKEEEWDWYLERTYHHIFTNDEKILGLAGEIGFKDFYFQTPKTVSLYGGEGSGSNYRIFPVDTPQDFLKLPLLGMVDKLRAGGVLAFLKISPFLSSYEKQTAKEFLIKTMGEKVWGAMWEELFRKKFGKYAENILASFIWARIKKRTQKLGYVKGGFQSFVNFLAEKNKQQGVFLNKDTSIVSIAQKRGEYAVDCISNSKKKTSVVFDVVISTLPTPAILQVGRELFPNTYINRLSKIKYLHAVNLVLATEKPVFNKEYWISVCDKKAPMMAIVQHTNFIDKKHYNNEHILYIANYVEETNPLFTQPQEWVQNHHLAYLNKLFGNIIVKKSYLFRTRFAQPIFDKEFPKNKPQFETPRKNFFIANLDMTYPYDRGTNYAVKLGRQVARLL